MTSDTRPEAEQRARPAYVPTSVHLSTLLDEAETAQVSVSWLIERLGVRSFGLTLILMALIALVPGASTIVGLLIAWPAIQMMLGYGGPVLPRFLARREIAVDRLARAVGFIVPRLRWLERLIRPRWPVVFRSSKRVTGFMMLLLGLTMISPFPFSHVIPAIVIMLLALAYLEEDGIMLLLSLAASLTSVAITAAALWLSVETADWIDRIWPT